MPYTDEQVFLIDLLYQSLDNTLEEQDSQLLTDALATEEWLQEEWMLIKNIRKKLSTYQIVEQTDFVAKVINHLPAKKEYVLQKLWQISVAAAVTAIVLAAGFIYYSSGSLNADAILGVDAITTIEDVYVLNY